MADEQPTGAAIEDYLVEDRTFPPPEGFKEPALVACPFLYDEADEDWQGFWARQAADLLDWDEEWHTILEWDLPVRQVVRRRQAQRLPQRRRPPRRRRARATRSPTTGRASRATPARSPTPTSTPTCSGSPTC